MKREEVCKKALEYLGTPFHHQARLKGVGIDCAGLCVELAKECGLYIDSVKDLKGYSRIPDGKSLRQVLEQGTAREKPISELKPADILLMRFRREPQHLAIYMPNNKIIHSYQTIGKVIMHDFDEQWQKRVVSVFEFHNIKD